MDRHPDDPPGCGREQMIVPVLFFMKIGFKNVDFERAGFQNFGVLPEHREMVAPAE